MNENRNIVDLYIYIFATLMHIVYIFIKSCTIPMMPAVVAMHYLHDYSFNNIFYYYIKIAYNISFESKLV